ncbi:DUF2059 domain-containing protein [Pseudomonas oryzihabitans]|uniref:DUF2059 domain-containing protein n=1 Tax=Pseudomonas oryzihabitans TaxID=47885 RepID=UPI002895CC1F|nr:DUF2059 domain-containing protein [Pseudomonas oryzihabitans]MDT3721037.1 DUF2059 domain-containing protein [Pseudomonas oryzihabitans]
MRQIIGMIVFTLAFQALAESKNEKIERLIEAQGLKEAWGQQLEQSKEYGLKFSAQINEQILSQLTPNEDFKQRFKVANDNFVEASGALWTADKMVSLWAKYYGPEFSEKELDQLISFYSSPIGQKDLKVTKSSLKSMYTYFEEANQPIIKKATDDYIKELKLIAIQCNCAKQSKPSTSTQPNTAQPN